MKKVKVYLVSLLIGLSEFCIAATPTITNVKAQYFHPWGKVAISYEVKGEIAPETTLFVCAKDTVAGNQYYADHTCLSGDISIAEGLHRIVWDMEKQGVAIDSGKVVFTVSYGLYLVVDLSVGKNAKTYPVSCMYSEPIGGWTDEYKTTKLVLRRIEPGSFNNGTVTITKPYYMGVFEVTQKQYELVTGNKPSYFSGATLPVERVSWNAIRGDSETHNWPTVKAVDVNSFVGCLRARTGLTFDLPTRAQWQYACRAGTTTNYYWGDSFDDYYDYAWYDGNSNSTTHFVGIKKENIWGLYDMQGNVWEWCLDYDSYSLSGSDPMGPTSGSNRHLCGGSFDCSWKSVGRFPSSVSYSYGFRLACSAEL